MRLEAFARVELGMTAAEFYALTPAAYEAYREAWERKIERDDAHFALVARQISEPYRNKTRFPRPFQLTDFMLYRKQKPIDPKDAARVLAAAFKSMGMKETHG